MKTQTPFTHYMVRRPHAQADADFGIENCSVCGDPIDYCPGCRQPDEDEAPTNCGATGVEHCRLGYPDFCDACVARFDKVTEDMVQDEKEHVASCIHSAVAPNMNRCIKCGGTWNGSRWATPLEAQQAADDQRAALEREGFQFID